MSFDNNNYVYRYEHGDLSLNRVSCQCKAEDTGRRFQHINAPVCQCSVIQVCDRRDPIRTTMLWSHVLYRLVSFRLAGKLFIYLPASIVVIEDSRNNDK